MKCGDLPGLSGPMAGARSLRYPHGLARALARISRCPSREVVSVVMGSMRKSAGSPGSARCGCKPLELNARQAKATEGGPWPCSAAHVPGRHRRPHPGFSSAVPGLTPPQAGAGSPRQPRVVAGRTSVDLALGSTELSTALARGSCGVEARRRSVRTARHDHGLPWAAGTDVRGCQAWRGR